MTFFYGLKEPDLARISILTATAFEFRAVGRAFPHSRRVTRYGRPCLLGSEPPHHVLLISTGMGPQNAGKTTNCLLQDGKWDLVVSTGFAGALGDFPIGSVILGSEVICDDPGAMGPSPVICDPAWLENVSRIDWGNRSHPLGRFVTVSRVLTRSEEKRELASRTGAVAVDMESGAIGQAASKKEVPFLIIRAISDGRSEDLPLDFNRFRSSGGWVAGATAGLFSVKCWKGLFRLYRQSREASRQLTRFFQLFFSAFLSKPSWPATPGAVT